MGGLQKRLHRLDDLVDRTAPQSLLLRAPPSLRLVGPATFSGGPQIAADVIKIAQEGPLALEDLLALQANPLGSISQNMDRTIGSPAGQTSAVTPAPARLCNASKGRSI